MLRPLLYLSVLITLAGAAGQTFTDSSEVAVSSCPITFYGRKYEQIYVNISSENAAVCFDGFFDPQTGGDCVVVSERTERAGLAVQPYTPGAEAMIRLNVSTISTRLECIVAVSLHHDQDTAVLNMASFGTQAALVFSPSSSGSAVFAVQVGGATVHSANVTTAEEEMVFVDVSGCRHAGILYEPGSAVTSDPDTCSRLTCDMTAVLRTFGCGPRERCHGNSICSLDAICTVTGPAIIDIHGQVTSVEDRCAYSLLALPDFHVVATFQERRRKDVSFLDGVTLRLDGPGVHIHLEQGGRVRLDDRQLSVNASARLVHGVALSRDQTGVTATAALSTHNASVFFDGYTAQILLTGLTAARSLQGLCGNSSRSLSELWRPAYSSDSCETRYSDAADSTIDCNMATARCDLLKEAPFTACHAHIDPAPFVTACADTMCRYPALDALSCQFLAAYARACGLHGSTAPAWRSKASCSAAEAFCQDRTCGAHEFCGEKTLGGRTRCFCRALYASKYRSTGALGEPTLCRQNAASLTLVGCLLEDKGIDYSALHLNDPTCRGHVDEQSHMVTFSFDSSNSCGTVVTANNSRVTYRNTITIQNSSSDLITRHDQVYIDFACVQARPDVRTVAFRIRDSSVIQQVTSGVWNYTLTMTAYTDADRTRAVESSTEVRLNQRIWVELRTDGLDGDVVAVVTESCWATQQASPTGSPRYDLIMNGCANPADRTVRVEGNGRGTSGSFSFTMFRFSGESDDVYLHCRLQLCVKQADGCAPVCSGAARRRRSRSRYEAPAFISLAWTN